MAGEKRIHSRWRGSRQRENKFIFQKRLPLKKRGTPCPQTTRRRQLRGGRIFCKKRKVEGAPHRPGGPASLAKKKPIQKADRSSLEGGGDGPALKRQYPHRISLSSLEVPAGGTNKWRKGHRSYSQNNVRNSLRVRRNTDYLSEGSLGHKQPLDAAKPKGGLRRLLRRRDEHSI